MNFRRWLVVALVGACCVLQGVGAEAAVDPLVRRAQIELKARGFDPGPADGLMGRRTRAAIVAFQRRSTLPQTGRLDEPTRDALWPAVAAQPATAATPPAASGSNGASEGKARAASGSGGSGGAATAGEPAAATPGAAGGSASGAGNTPAAAAPANPPPPRRVSRSPLSYANLGWAAPDSGQALAARHGKGDRSPIQSRATGSLVVPDSTQIYILRKGQRLPGFACEPARGQLHMDMAMGLDGPVTFTSLDDEGYCQLGFGILLEEGQVIEFEEAWWGERRIRGGKVRVGPGGLEYLRGG